MLVALDGLRRIEAREAVRFVEYRCPHCGAPVVLRQGGSAGVRFAHRRRSSCDWNRSESQAHQLAKLALRDAIVARGLRTELEWELPWMERPLESSEDLTVDRRNDRRADLVVWSPTGRPVVIELQHSALTLDQLEQRAFFYAGAGAAQIWLPFLDGELLTAAAERPGGKEGNRHIARYAVPRWQRWLHGYNFGELWFYDSVGAALWRGQLSAHRITVTPQNWLQKGLNDVHNGALEYRYASKRWRDLTLWGPYRPDMLRIDLGYRAAAELSGYRYPAGPTARFVAPVPVIERDQHAHPLSEYPDDDDGT